MNNLSEKQKKVLYNTAVVILAIASAFLNKYLIEPYATYFNLILRVVVLFAYIHIIRHANNDIGDLMILIKIFFIVSSFDIFLITINNIDKIIKGENNSFEISKLIDFICSGFLLYLSSKRKKTMLSETKLSE